MKIAFTTYGNDWKENVDIRFGRARGFFIVDDESGQTSYIDNKENVEAAHGAGTQAAKAIIDAGVGVLITGKTGPKAGQVLKSAGVNVFGGIGYATIEEAYDRYKKGMLTEQPL